MSQLSCCSAKEFAGPEPRPGSTLQARELLRHRLRAVFAELDLPSLCDAPCGDGTWIHEVTEGLDVVPEVVAQTMAREKLAARHFHAVGYISVTPLPKVDAVLCRDCLVHLPLDVAAAVLRNIKASGSTWLLTTTFANTTENHQARMGMWQPLNRTLPPFGSPKLIQIIGEHRPNPADKHNDKSLGAWRIADL